MRVRVPDASVILKWVLPPENESYADAAEIMRDGFVTGEIELLVPTLWFFEVGNTLTRKFPRQADALLATLISLQLPEAHLNLEWQSLAIRLSTQHQVTFYDAAYHALAIVQGRLFVTADRKHLERVQADQHAQRIEDWGGRFALVNFLGVMVIGIEVVTGLCKSDSNAYRCREYSITVHLWANMRSLR